LTFKTDPDNTEFLFELVNREPSSGGDAIVLRSYNNIFSIPMDEEHISWQLDDPSGTALSDVKLPTSFNLSLWQQVFGLTITGETFPFPDQHYFIRAVIDTVNQVQPAWGTASQALSAGSKEVANSGIIGLLGLVAAPFAAIVALKRIHRAS